MKAEVGERLETMEKNPGPRMGGRGKATENRKASGNEIGGGG